MYEGLGFRSAGVRPRYYQDNGEDALIMWLDEKFANVLCNWRSAPRRTSAPPRWVAGADGLRRHVRA